MKTSVRRALGAVAMAVGLACAGGEAGAQQAAVRVLGGEVYPYTIGENGAPIVGYTSSTPRIWRVGSGWSGVGEGVRPAALSGDGRVIMGGTGQCNLESSSWNVVILREGESPRVVHSGGIGYRGPGIGCGGTAKCGLSSDGSRGYFVICQPAYFSCGYLYYVWRSGLGAVAVPIEVQAMSSDGRYFTGVRSPRCDIVGCVPNVIRWDSDTGELLFVPNYSDVPLFGTVRAINISRNGRWVLGWSTGATRRRVFEWSQASDVMELPLPGGAVVDTHMASAVSNDGRFVVGTCDRNVAGVGAMRFATLWGDRVAYDLGSFLIQRGATVPEGSRLESAVDMTPDARYVVGTIVLAGGVSTGYIARLGLSCDADVDNGGGAGVKDGAVTIEDLLYYLGEYAAGRVAADVDDGSGEGWRDDAVTIEDLLYFLERFAAGC
jgi:hypothetical protein